MEGEGSTGVRISSARLTDVYLRPDGQYVDGHMALELSCVSVGSVEVRRVDSIELDEENGFDLSDYDERALKFAYDYSEKLLAIDVNIEITQMLDTAWELFAKYFWKEEVAIKSELVEKYWPKTE